MLITRRVEPGLPSTRKELTFFILHELGHALALEHDNQSPEANCDTEFDWPKVLRQHTVDKKEVDFNLRTKLAEPKTAHDCLR